jgi:molybdenum cofactor cytidylyltransferase
MMACANVAAALLAAGAGTRFGGNKLEAMLGDEMLGLHAARTLVGLGCGHRFAIHDPAHGAFAHALNDLGFTCIDNVAPEKGLSHSLALAANAALDTDATHMLVCLADMPFVTAQHLAALMGRRGDQIIASAIGDVRLPPALFPRACWPDLIELTGDAGARPLLRDAIAIQGSSDMLADIDTRADLHRSSP